MDSHTLASMIGGRIKHLRGEAGLSQAQLAAKLGISTSIVSQYENGSRVPSPQVLNSLAKILGASLDFIFGHEEIDKGFFADEEFVAFLNTYKELPPDKQLIIHEMTKVLKKLQPLDGK